jgi:hypothetical protein
MVNTATGYRVHACDGTVYTPHVDLALTASGQVYVCQTHSNAGNVVKYVPNLTSRVTVWNQANMRPLGVATATNRAFIASRRSAGGVLVAVDSSQAFIDSTASGLLLNDVEVQPGAGSFVVAHAGGVHRYQIAAGLPLLDTWNKLTPIVDVETVTDGVFAAQDNGTAGQLDRLTVDLKNHPVATWDDLGAKPRMVDIKVSADETQLMAASVKGATQKSTRLAAAALVAGPSYALTASRTAYIKPDLSALLATDTGVYRVDAAGMSLLRFAPAAPGEREAEFVMEPVTNPVKGAIQISFFLPQTRHVRLRIFDLAGRQVAELVNGTRPAGRHDALWNAGERSGVFFYRLEAGSAKRSGKIVVIE